MLLTNCPNCGAPLPANGICEFCGTDTRDKGIRGICIDKIIGVEVKDSDGNVYFSIKSEDLCNVGN